MLEGLEQEGLPAIFVSFAPLAAGVDSVNDAGLVDF